MNDSEISRLLADASPAARDTAFELAVMSRIEKQRFRRAVMRDSALALAAALLLAITVPMLSGMASVFSSNLVIASLLLAASVVLPQSRLIRDD